jgi:hypothetical protein
MEWLEKRHVAEAQKANDALLTLKFRLSYNLVSAGKLFTGFARRRTSSVFFRLVKRVV